MLLTAWSAAGIFGPVLVATKNQEGTTTLHLALAWRFVGIPLTLGALRTLINAMKLFQ
jgi:hypothetical protein